MLTGGIEISSPAVSYPHGVDLEMLASHQERRAEKFKAKAARQKPRLARRAKAKAALGTGGWPRRITASLSWLLYAFKR
jgi:hypothetical protein